MRDHHSKSIRHQRGFTLVEVLIAIAVVTMLIGFFVSSGVDGIDQAKTGAAQNQVANRIAQGVAARYGSTLTLSGVTAAQLQETTTTPFGDTWSVSATGARTVTIAYPVTSASDADVTGAAMASYLTGITGTSVISAASYNATTDTLSITYTL